MLVRVIVGFALSALVAGFAFRRGSLSRSGALAALLIGMSIYVGGGGGWFAALLTFFVTSTLLAKVGHARKALLKREFEKGDQRDAWQALANGGVAAGFALMMGLSPAPSWALAFVGALATANGDTWATELGTLSRREPILLTRLKRVPRGTSGAVSPLGLLATLLGGLAIGGTAAAFSTQFSAPWWLLVAAGALSGVGGALVDSLLGATVQAGYYCTVCQVHTEGHVHHCGQRAERVRGFRYCDNDAVNLAATVFGALFAMALALLS